VASVAAGTYALAPSYAGNGNYLTANGSGSLVVSNPPLTVTAVASTGGSTPGKVQVGDTFSMTFANALNPSTITTTAGATTMTLCDNKSSCSAANSTNFVIAGLTTATGFTVASAYEASGGSTTTAGTLSLSNANKTVTYTVTGAPTGGTLGTGVAVSVAVTPNSAIKDTNGTAASGTYTTPSSIVLF
jgi:hypothetical protein